MNNSLKVKRLVGVASLAAIVVVLQLIANYITIGTINITLALIPIVVGAIIYGPLVGFGLGALMGIVVLTAPSTQGFLNVNPFVTILLCVLKTGIAGLVSGLLFKIINKKNFYAAIVVATLIVPVINTGLFILGSALFFQTVFGAESFSGALPVIIGVVFGTNFTIELNRFPRKTGYQLLYYKLPDYFTSVLSDSLKKELEKPTVLTEKVDVAGEYYTYYGKVYIKNNYLIVDFINDESEAYAQMNTIMEVYFNVKYSFKFKQVTYNDRLLAVATVSGVLNNQATEESDDIYPTGKIETHYIDIDTNEEIKDSIEEEEIIGTKYSKKFVKIKDYTFVENTNDDIEFEEEQQTVYYKYRKTKSNKPMILENPKTENKSLIIIITTTIVLSTITLIYKKKRI